MKRAIVLSGGGSLGAYQLGAWRALRSLGVDYQMVTGTSIGSINAALMVQGDFDLASHLWETITVDQVMVDGINMYTQIEKYLNQGAELQAFLKRYARNRGADITPLIDLVRRSVSEERVRASGIDFGLVAVRFPTLSPLELMIRDIPDGLLIDYLIASASCFPAFPVHRIGDQGFIDGGYYDNMPVNLALGNGAEEVVAIDLYTSIPHPAMLDRPWMTFVGPSQKLGSILLFDRDVLNRNITLGEYDTLRAFGRVRGIRYSFDSDALTPHLTRARHFSLRTAQLEDAMAYRRAVTRRIAGTPLSDALKNALPRRKNVSDFDELLVAAELLADWCALESVHLYSLDEFDEALVKALPIAEAREWIGNATERDILSVGKLEHKLAATVLAFLLKKGALDTAALRAAARRPEDLLAACYLEGCLPEG